MKLLITLLLTLTMFSASAQWADTTAHQRIDHINLQLDKAHRQYRTGTFLVTAGLVMNGLALIAGENGGGGFLAGFGSLFLIGGTVVHIDSHKYIGRTRK
jgi:hypothetical protein